MYSEEVTAQLLNFLAGKEYDSFLSTVSSYTENEIVGAQMSNILDEWRKLQLARKNGLMDDEQVHLAMTAYFNKRSREIPELLKEADREGSGNLDA
ncbi:hypothetical protein [Fulvivirga sedimenti]|uniref:Uncharacterized protein n=1 Tax=Fulvivirga sedimenti TaxID=2879465 RepID=A0A9X1L2C7_9BACT|nr:hypothetical protein [Fulvivirga sedimenti]MCA6079157.1 hypothetical protein [Fulvivirga sedimenti]